MQRYRVLGASLVFFSGYVTHLTVVSDWTARGKAIIFVIIFFIAYIGLAGILSDSAKSFKDNVFHGLNILNLLP